MIMDTILWKNCDYRPPRYKDLREMLKKTVELRKSMWLAEDGPDVSPGKTALIVTSSSVG